MTVTVFVCDTVTGERLAILPVASFSYERLLNLGGGGSAAIPVNDVNVQKMGDLYPLLNHWSRTLVLDVDGAVVYAGMIVDDDYDHESGMWTFQHVDIWSLLARRIVIDHDIPAGDAKELKQTYTSLSPSTVIKRLIQLCTNGVSSWNLTLPISLPADEAGSITQSIYGYHLSNLVDLISGFIAETNGPDVDFRPRWVSNALDWEMRAGTVASPKLTSGEWTWNLGATKNPVQKLHVRRNAQKVVTYAIAVGEGSGADVLVRSNVDTTPAYPALEDTFMFKNTDNVTALQRKAGGALATYGTPTEVWEFGIRWDGDPAVTDLLLGGTAHIHVGSDPLLKNNPGLVSGRKDLRVVGFSGDLSGNVSLKFQPEGA